MLNIDFEDKFHDTFYDTLYTYKAFKEICNPSIIHKEYNNRTHKSKVKLDTDVLFKQFSKMYIKRDKQ